MKLITEFYLKTCRLCGTHTKVHTNLEDNENKSYLQLIYKLLKIKTDREDHFPKNICSYCVTELRRFERFLNTCKKTQRTIMLVAETYTEQNMEPGNAKITKAVELFEAPNSTLPESKPSAVKSTQEEQTKHSLNETYSLAETKSQEKTNNPVEKLTSAPEKNSSENLNVRRKSSRIAKLQKFYETRNLPLPPSLKPVVVKSTRERQTKHSLNQTYSLVTISESKENHNNVPVEKSSTFAAEKCRTQTLKKTTLRIPNSEKTLETPNLPVLPSSKPVVINCTREKQTQHDETYSLATISESKENHNNVPVEKSTFAGEKGRTQKVEKTTSRIPNSEKTLETPNLPLLPPSKPVVINCIRKKQTKHSLNETYSLLTIQESKENHNSNVPAGKSTFAAIKCGSQTVKKTSSRIPKSEKILATHNLPLPPTSKSIVVQSTREKQTKHSLNETYTIVTISEPKENHKVLAEKSTFAAKRCRSQNVKKISSHNTEPEKLPETHHSSLPASKTLVCKFNFTNLKQTKRSPDRTCSSATTESKDQHNMASVKSENWKIFRNAMDQTTLYVCQKCDCVLICEEATSAHVCQNTCYDSRSMKSFADTTQELTDSDDALPNDDLVQTTKIGRFVIASEDDEVPETFKRPKKRRKVRNHCDDRI